MNDNNTHLSVLAWVGILGIIAGFIISVIPRQLDSSALLWSVIGAGLLQLGIVSVIGWLVARAVIAQLLFKPRPMTPTDGRG